jgi:SAM-dependent methyltransferase
MSSRCPICSSSCQTGKYTYECPDCDLEFLGTWGQKEKVHRLYKKLTYKSNIKPGPIKHNEYHRRFEIIRPYLDKQTALLEIGAGEGHFLKLVKPLVGIADACEISPYHAKKLRQKGYTVIDKDITLAKPRQYKLVCMYAVLEHIPQVKKYLISLKEWITPDGILFIEVPSLNCAMLRYYDIPEYRKHFYRSQHLYHFTEKSLRRLLNSCDYDCVVSPFQNASLTNHFHWLHTGKRQPTTNDMVSVTLPRKSKNLTEVLEKTDNFYRKQLTTKGISDILIAQARNYP